MNKSLHNDDSKKELEYCSKEREPKEFSDGYEGKDSNRSLYKIYGGSSSKVNKLREYRLSTEIEKTLDFCEAEKQTLDNSIQPKINQDSTKYRQFELEISENSVDQEEQFNRIIDKNFGKLISYFKDYFEKSRKHNKYVCDSRRCKIKELLLTMSKNEYSGSESKEADYSTSSQLANRFNSTMKLNENDQSNPNAESYLKKMVASNINMKSIYDFYVNETYDENILNMYLRILDVYNEYLFYQNQHDMPNIQNFYINYLAIFRTKHDIVQYLINYISFSKIKIFDTESVQKVIEDNRNGGLNEEIDILLEDFYNNDIYVLPISKKEQQRLCVVVIQLIEEKIFIQLYDRMRNEFNEDELEELNSNISQDVHDFLERAQMTYGVSYDENKVDGSTHTIEVETESDMIPAVLQIAENIICHQDAAQTETVKKVRHKICDRILSLYLLE